ncbi:DUF294 nucleotidyltransferase-like domain-containing protein [Corynebacterium hansenii]|uniref:DUF294 nucleotidyltransferase-like domain-containing protein n=1 Tax=Corynebacterium hansenii TaxID=394964 RepID=A0ABV7ZR68_9CORY|nr:DUF294 nucleotidyltransferase-like domain-containing protein [Corynebacterium hansenii]WJY99665.1 Arabinose 5-phosphate isomerase KdsD [Corynebacterium hansenii]
MSVELDEIREFLRQTPPFSELPEDELNALPRRLTMRYARRGQEIIAAGRSSDALYVVRSGLVDVFDASGTLLDRRDDGAAMGYSTMLSHEPSLYTMTAVEDTLLLVFPEEVFDDLMGRYPQVSRHFGGENARIRAVASDLRSSASSDALRTRVADLMAGPPVHIGSGATIGDGAKLMTERNVSSLLIIDDGDLTGILTDRDLRRRVLAAGHGPDIAIADAMTPNPVTVDPSMLAFEAMLLMAERGYHHLPVSDDSGVVGMIVIGDLLRTLHTDPVYATATLARKKTVAEIAEVAANSRRVVSRFVDRGVSADEISRLLTVTADAVTRRLLDMAEDEFGAPPVPYSFVVLGSQGRREMGMASDQDNALIIDDSYDEATHGEYFRNISEFVCGALAECGYPLCPGDMMASNPDWRMSLSRWKTVFHQWITRPDPDALLHAQTFFDIRGIHGEDELVEELRATYVPIAEGSKRLHAHLAKLAAHREPPLGFFRGLVLEKGGSHENTLDIKKGGLATVVQMARLFAVASGLPQIGTRERLNAAVGAGAVSRQGADDLRDAFDFLATVQLGHQRAAVNAGGEPDNHVNPKELSRLEREHLRDAFGVIRRLQQSLATKYPISQMS